MNGILGAEYAKARKNKLHLAYRYKTRAQIVVDAIRKYSKVKSNIKLLDMGSADGLTVKEICALTDVEKCIGVEYSKELIEQISDLPPNINIIQGDITNLPNDIGEYNVVSALAILEHLPDPQKAVLEAKKVLRKGGLLIATCPNPIWDKVSDKLKFSKNDHHIVEMNKKAMCAMIEQSGMKVITFEKFMFAPVGVLPYLKIPVSPIFSNRVDNFIRLLRIFNFLFVNQCVIAEKVD